MDTLISFDEGTYALRAANISCVGGHEEDSPLVYYVWSKV